MWYSLSFWGNFHSPKPVSEARGELFSCMHIPEIKHVSLWSGKKIHFLEFSHRFPLYLLSAFRPFQETLNGLFLKVILNNYGYFTRKRVPELFTLLFQTFLTKRFWFLKALFYLGRDWHSKLFSKIQV
jgi:hypothetical protein